MKTISKDKIININTNLLCNNSINTVEFKEKDIAMEMKKIDSIELNYENGELVPLKSDSVKISNYKKYIKNSDDGTLIMEYVAFDYSIDARDVLHTGDFEMIAQHDSSENIEYSRANSKTLLTSELFVLLTQQLFYINGYCNDKITASVTIMTREQDKLRANKFKLSLYGVKIEKAEIYKSISSKSTENMADKKIEKFNLDDNFMFNTKSGVMKNNQNQSNFLIKNFVKLDVITNPQHATVSTMYPTDCDVYVTIKQKDYNSKELIIRQGATMSEEVALDTFWKNTTIENIRASENSKYAYDPDKYQVINLELQQLLGDRLAEKILENYSTPRQSVNVTVPVLSKDDVYNVGEVVKIIMLSRSQLLINAGSRTEMERRYSFANYDSGEPKQFIITSVELKYDGLWRQNLEMLEVPYSRIAKAHANQ